jgi:hypothetical protein
MKIHESLEWSFVCGLVSEMLQRNPNPIPKIYKTLDELNTEALRTAYSGQNIDV